MNFAAESTFDPRWPPSPPPGIWAGNVTHMHTETPPQLECLRFAHSISTWKNAHCDTLRG